MLCIVTVGYALVAKRLSSTIVTAPMIFLGLGVVFATSGFITPETGEALLHPVAEVTLVVLLFLDAAQTDFAALKRRFVWPVRMLVIGLPLSIAFGTIAGALFFPDWPIVAVALAAAILAPTDAALGQAVVTNEAIPIRPRRALTVESGLNDGSLRSCHNYFIIHIVESRSDAIRIAHDEAVAITNCASDGVTTVPVLSCTAENGRDIELLAD